VTDPRDRIDDWLATDVTPLAPPAGTLDRIRRRARQRRSRRVVVASAGCAVVLAAAVAAPGVVAGLRGGGKPPAAAGARSAAVTRLPGGQPTSSPGADESQSAGPIQQQQRSVLSVGTSGTVPPGHFRPTSVTFVGTGQGGLVGAVIGQAGPPCATSDCTSLAGTSDYGASWYGVSAPLAPGPSGTSGVSQLRFANLRDGWAFGPALYETTGGGWPWQQVSTGGQRVIDLEASGQSALAVFATCSGTGTGYATGCTSFALYAGAAGTTAFTPVAVPVAYRHMSTAQPSSAQLIIAAGTGYLLTPSGAVLSGPVTGGAWTLAGQAPCTPGQAQPDGAPSGAQLAANQQELLLACTGQPGTPAGQVALYSSTTGGATWQTVSSVAQSGSLTSLTSATAGQVVLATTNGLYYSADGGTTWQPASLGATAPDGGFSYVGMTTPQLGVAVPADSLLGEIYVTRDGGKTWSPSPIAG
jgi:hypothetical protein